MSDNKYDFHVTYDNCKINFSSLIYGERFIEIIIPKELEGIDFKMSICFTPKNDCYFLRTLSGNIYPTSKDIINRKIIYDRLVPSCPYLYGYMKFFIHFENVIEKYIEEIRRYLAIFPQDIENEIIKFLGKPSFYFTAELTV